MQGLTLKYFNLIKIKMADYRLLLILLFLISGKPCYISREECDLKNFNSTSFKVEQDLSLP